MPDALMYQEEAFVVLEPDQGEQLLTPEELLDKLIGILGTNPLDLPKDMEKLIEIRDKALYLRDNYCELTLEGGAYIQWYVTRLEKPRSSF